MTQHEESKSLRKLLFSDKMEFIMEAHSPLAAIINEKVGFKAIWASGLSISTLLGMRDCNEVSSDQLLDILELMRYSVDTPILVDGDTGFGNFNNARIFVRKLCALGIDGVCIEDKVFPKKNSFIENEQFLAPIDEFCGKIMACKDAQLHDDFVLVARVEALIAGKGIGEALTRAMAYSEAGADAILIHSKKQDAEEIIKFSKAWNERTPLLVVPTTYYKTPTTELENAGIKNIIWANHNIRACLTSMLAVSTSIFQNKSISLVENNIATIKDIFNLLNYEELECAEEKYMNFIQKERMANER